ncbi:MAG: hypothetical protein ACRDIY_15620, partial [Chloroflexota bacterium]
MSTLAARPRLAVIGGGGSMGRLFARLLCQWAREVYLFDFFDSPANSASLVKAFDDLQHEGTNGRLRASYYA